MTTRYIPEIIYSVATISLGMHLLYHRKEAEDQRAYFASRISLLEDTIVRLRTGVHVPQFDFDLIRRLAREPQTNRALARGIAPKEEIGWRDVWLGRKDQGASEKWEQRDWEQVKKEMESTQ